MGCKQMTGKVTPVESVHSTDPAVSKKHRHHHDQQAKASNWLDKEAENNGMEETDGGTPHNQHNPHSNKKPKMFHRNNHSQPTTASSKPHTALADTMDPFTMDKNNRLDRSNGIASGINKPNLSLPDSLIKLNSHSSKQSSKTGALATAPLSSPHPPAEASLLAAASHSLKHHKELSSSQIDFFNMLDKKIQEGPDYEQSSGNHVAEQKS